MLLFTDLLTSTTAALTWATHRLLIVAGIVSIAHYAGYLHRFVWYLAERECGKVLNHSTVTAGSVHCDLLRGRYWATNVVVHAPQRELWEWEAPLVARVGRIYVEVNLVSVLVRLLIFREEIPLEVETVQVSDVQVFVERKYNVYNFFLLDPHVILPDPRVLRQAAAAAATNGNDGVEALEESVKDVGVVVEENNGASTTAIETSTTAAIGTTATTKTTTASTGEASTDAASSFEPSKAVEHTAQTVVDDMLHAVQRAADEGNAAPLFNHYRHTLTDQLKLLAGGSTPVVATMQESVTLLKHVTQTISHTAHAAQSVVVPERRSLPGDRVVYGRIGRVLLQDVRVFLQHTNNDWTRPPMVLKTLALRAHEFCPPKSATCGTVQSPPRRRRKGATTTTNTNGNTATMPKHPWREDDTLYDPQLPALHQPLDVILDIVLKRVLAETAQKDTGTFFQTAMSQAADVFVSKRDAESSV